jgi:hypothetical protein
LHSTPYEGLPLFSKIIGAAEHEVEQAISSGISLGIIKPEWVALLPIQAELSHCLPPILSQRPKKLHDILTQVKQAGQSPACDSIQLRVWLKQNPQKR